MRRPTCDYRRPSRISGFDRFDLGPVVVRADAKFIVELEPRRLSSFEGQLPRNGFATHIVVRVYQRISIVWGLLVEGHRCDPELLFAHPADRLSVRHQQRAQVGGRARHASGVALVHRTGLRSWRSSRPAIELGELIGSLHAALTSRVGYRVPPYMHARPLYINSRRRED